jgi:hypothetical protein
MATQRAYQCQVSVPAVVRPTAATYRNHDAAAYRGARRS